MRFFLRHFVLTQSLILPHNPLIGWLFSKVTIGLHSKFIFSRRILYMCMMATYFVWRAGILMSSENWVPINQDLNYGRVIHISNNIYTSILSVSKQPEQFVDVICTADCRNWNWGLAFMCDFLDYLNEVYERTA
jgi:hypothetical protein